MTSARKWPLVGATLAVVLVGALLVLPVVVRLLAVRQLEAMTGRDVSIADVDLNLFTRRLAATDLRVEGRSGQPPLTLARLEARYRLLALLRGRVHLDRLALVAPFVYLERTAPDQFNVSDVIDRVMAPRPRGEPVHAVIETLTVRGGAVHFDDRAVSPHRQWTLTELALTAHDLATVADAEKGRAKATFVLAGAPGSLVVEPLRVRPLHARATFTLEGADLGPLVAYTPTDAPLRLTDGQLTTRLTATYDPSGTLSVDGEATFADVRVSRPEQNVPFLAAPAVTLHARDLRYTEGDIAARWIELGAERITVHDATAPRARPLDVTAVTLIFDGRLPAASTHGPGPPGRLTFSAELPRDGRIGADGTAELWPVVADLGVEASADVALAQIWMPVDAAVAPAAGRLRSTLQLAYGPDRGLVVSGQSRVSNLEVVRRGQDPPLVFDDEVTATVRDVRVRDGAVVLGRFQIRGSPTIVDATVSPPQRVHLPRVVLTAQRGGYPARQHTDVSLRVVLPGGGHIEANGSGRLGPTALALTVRAHSVDVLLSKPYLPKKSPVTLDEGRLEALLRVVWASSALRVGGTFTARDLTLTREGQSEPFIHHPSLEGIIKGLVVEDGQLALSRLSLEGKPAVVDATASPPQRFEARSMNLEVSDLTWPGQRPARVEGRGEVADGGRVALAGSLHPKTLDTDVRARFENVDVTRVQAYLPGTVPLRIENGRGQMTVGLRHRRPDGLRIEASGAVDDFALLAMVGPGLRVRDEQMTFSVADLVLHDGAVSLDAATVDVTPLVGRPDQAPKAFGQLDLWLKNLAWPGRGPARFGVEGDLPDSGRLVAEGTLTPGPWTMEATVELTSAPVGPVAALLPIDAPLGGRLDVQLTTEVRPGRDPAVVVKGDVTASNLRIGPDDSPPVRIDHVEVEGLDWHGTTLALAKLIVEGTAVVIERERDGSFPLRAMLTDDTLDDAPAAATREIAQSLPAGAEPSGREELEVVIGELRVVDGNVRFIDRTTTPFYSEEIAHLFLTVRNLSTLDDRPAPLELQGIVGADAALDLQGHIAPFGSPFFLDVAGELRDFSVPRTNPYLRRLLDWIARRGQLTTKVHYRIVGDQLTATNELLVERLDIAPAAGDGQAERLVGVPLGLAVALLKDARGDIRFTLPVSGKLSSPQFSFGDAIRRAFKNVLSRLISAPFRAIGSVFQRDGEVAEVAIDPVRFDPGSAALSPDAAAHLQRVADFLRASPYVRLALEPVVGERDLRALRAQEVTARIQRFQRQEDIGFAEAARRLFHRGLPGRKLPEKVDEIITQLADVEPLPAEAASRLAQLRLDVTRTHLAEEAGIERERLLTAGGPAIGADGQGRVDFAPRPAS